MDPADHLRAARLTSLAHDEHFAGATAGLLHDLPIACPPEAPVIATGASDDVVLRDGLPCAGLARTVVGLVATLDAPEAVAVVDVALHRLREVRRDVAFRADLLARLASVPPPLQPRTRALLGLAAAAAASPDESRSRVLFARAGIEPADLHLPIVAAAGSLAPRLRRAGADPRGAGYLATAPFAWPAARVAGFCRASAPSRLVATRDARLDHGLATAGWRVLAWTPGDLATPDTRAALVVRLAGLLATPACPAPGLAAAVA